MITNFQTPESTLYMMACAFGGYEQIREAYKVAIKEKYRFLAYGDAMLIILIFEKNTPSLQPVVQE